jgi:hypothetical protein
MTLQIANWSDSKWIESYAEKQLKELNNKKTTLIAIQVKMAKTEMER